MHVKEGQFVKKGDLLATLETNLVTQEVAIAKAELKISEARLNLLLAGTRKEDLITQEKRVIAMKSRWRNVRDNLRQLDKLASSGAVAMQEILAAKYLEQQLRAETEAEEASLDKMQKGPRSEDTAEARANVERALAALNLSMEKMWLGFILRTIFCLSFRGASTS